MIPQNKDISFVVQGVFDRSSTMKCLRALKKLFPESEIILSTWEGTDTSAAEPLCSKIILSPDPGGQLCSFGFRNNLNRQLVSTKAGIAEASRKYCMKMRSDLIFESKKFLSYYSLFPKRDETYLFFKERVIFSSFFFKKYITNRVDVLPVPYHISDWLSFGLLEDIRLLWDIPIPAEPDFSSYFINHSRDYISKDLFNQPHRLAPEQYILIEALKKKFPDKSYPAHYRDFCDEDCLFYDKITANNMIILEPWQMKMYSDKNTPSPYKTWSRNALIYRYSWVNPGPYDFYEFGRDYQKHCDSSYKPPFMAGVLSKIGRHGGME